MAKSQYSVKVEPYLELIEGWTREGLVMSQIAEKLGISKTTLCSCMYLYNVVLQIAEKQHYTNTCKNILNFLNA